MSRRERLIRDLIDGLTGLDKAVLMDVYRHLKLVHMVGSEGRRALPELDRDYPSQGVFEATRTGDGRYVYGFDSASDMLEAEIALNDELPEGVRRSLERLVDELVTVGALDPPTGAAIRRAESRSSSSRRSGVDVPFADRLRLESVYTWAELAGGFGFSVGYLNRAGGMPTLPAHDAVMAITHPGGGKSFDYGDYRDGGDLIYTGRGQVGHQKLEGANRDVADNRRRILVFEGAGEALLRYLGTATCVEYWPDAGLDRNGDRRRIYRFRLRFDRARTVRGRLD